MIALSTLRGCFPHYWKLQNIIHVFGDVSSDARKITLIKGLQMRHLYFTKKKNYPENVTILNILTLYTSDKNQELMSI